jgi:hypothetical protein
MCTKRNPAAAGSGARNADLVEAAIGIHLGPRPRIFQEWIDFAAINRAAIPALPAILARLVPGGKRAGGACSQVEFLGYPCGSSHPRAKATGLVEAILKPDCPVSAALTEADKAALKKIAKEASGAH